MKLKLNNKLFIILILILFIIILINFVKLRNLTYFSNHVMYKSRLPHLVESFDENNKIIFISGINLYNILKEDNDDYYKSFYKTDFKVRNIKNINEYIQLIQKSTTDFSNEEKIKLNKCIKDINIILSNIRDLEWFDGNKAIDIPWKIGCIKGKLYENGLPHTRDDIIILSTDHIREYSEKKLTKTLLHEKVHIYQKIYKNDIDKYLKNNNFMRVKKRDANDNIRANPDLDNWIYKDNKYLYKAEYIDNPLTVEDIIYKPINNQSYEHPFERMAIDIENFI